MKFGYLILRKIIKFVSTRCQIVRLKCTKFNFGWGSAPDPVGRAYSAPPDPVAGFNGPTCKGRGWECDGKGERKRGGKDRKREGTPIKGCTPMFEVLKNTLLPFWRSKP